MATKFELSSKIDVIRYYGGQSKGMCFDFLIKGTSVKMEISEVNLLELIKEINVAQNQQHSIL